MSDTGVYKYTSSVQRKILAMLWRDEKSYTVYRETIKPRYFSRAIHVDICRIVFDYHERFGVSPSLDALVEETTNMCSRTKSKEKLLDDYLDELDIMSRLEFNDYDYIQSKILSFGKRQALVDAILESADILEKKPDTEYGSIEGLVKSAMLVGEDTTELGTSIFDDIQGRFLGYLSDDDVIERIPTGMEALDECLGGGVGRTEMCVIIAPPGKGKALAPDTPVLTPSGYVRIDSIRVGDSVISVDGTATTVTNVFNHENKHMYKVRFLDGSEVVCCDEHLWSVRDRNDRLSHRGYRTMQLGDMLHNIRIEHGTRCNYSIPTMTGPSELIARGDITIDPWVVGAFIGDGCSSNNLSFNNTEPDVISKFNKLLPYGCRLSNTDPSTVEHAIVIDKSYSGSGSHNTFRSALGELGLLGKRSYDKFIPEAYLFADVDSRVELLRGLMDTDGWVKSKTSMEYSTASSTLAYQVKFLCESLGMVAKVSTHMSRYRQDGEVHETRTQYTVLVNHFSFMPVSSSKHLGKLAQPTQQERFVSSVEYVGDGPAVCITVDHPSSLYVIKDGIVTHNTTMLISMAAQAMEEGYNVLHISLENNEKQILRNYDLRLLRHNMDYIRENVDRSIAAMFNIQKYRKGELRVKKYPTKSVTVAQLRNLIDQLRVVEGFIPDVVVVDYGMILKPDHNYADKRSGIEEIYEGLRALADDYNVALYTAAQGNRGSLSKKVVTTADLAECFAIANIADVCVALCQTNKEKSQGIMRGFLAKNRDNPDGMILQGKIAYDIKKIDFYNTVEMSEQDSSDEDEDDWEA